MSTRVKRTTVKPVETKTKQKNGKNPWSLLLGALLIALAVWVGIGLLRGSWSQPNLFVGTQQVPQGSSLALQGAQNGLQQLGSQIGAAFQGRPSGGDFLRYSCESLPEALQGECRQRKVQMLNNGQCAELSQIDPVTGSVCYDLFGQGAYPHSLPIVEQQPQGPSSFAAQHCANEPSLGRYPPQQDGPIKGQWTLDLHSQDSIDEAAPYKSGLRTPTWNEMLYNPGALQAIRANGASSDIQTVQSTLG
jgi:hypothetical protein